MRALFCAAALLVLLGGCASDGQRYRAEYRGPYTAVYYERGFSCSPWHDPFLRGHHGHAWYPCLGAGYAPWWHHGYFALRDPFWPYHGYPFGPPWRYTWAPPVRASSAVRRLQAADPGLDYPRYPMLVPQRARDLGADRRSWAGNASRTRGAGLDSRGDGGRNVAPGRSGPEMASPRAAVSAPRAAQPAQRGPSRARQED